VSIYPVAGRWLFVQRIDPHCYHAYKMLQLYYLGPGMARLGSVELGLCLVLANNVIIVTGQN